MHHRRRREEIFTSTAKGAIHSWPGQNPSSKWNVQAEEEETLLKLCSHWQVIGSVKKQAGLQGSRCLKMHTWIYIFVRTPNPILSWPSLLSLPRNLLKINFRGPGPQSHPQTVLRSYLSDCCNANCFSSRCVQATLCFRGPNHAKNQVVTFHCISWAQLVLTRPTWLFPVCVLSVLFLVPTCYYFYISCFTLPLINVLPYMMHTKYLRICT